MDLSSPDAPEVRPRHIADTLVVVLSTGASLDIWRGCGILQREWSLYERLSGRYGRIILVTEGGRAEGEIARELPSACPVSVVHNPAGHERAVFAADAAHEVRGLLADVDRAAGSALVRIDQMCGGDLAVLIARALREAGIRTGLIARGGYPWSRFAAWEFGPESAQAAEAAAEEGELCRAADVVTGTTESMLDDLRWRHALGAERTVLVPNFVPSDAAPDPRIAREPNRVLFAGRLVEQKRVGLLIDAVAHARSAAIEATGSPLRLVIVGGGVLERRLRDLAAARQIGAVFLPRMPHAALLDEMRRCAVYCQTSAYEGHPKTVLEAMACGAPVVVTDSPGLGGVVQNADTGLVVESTPEAVAAALLRFVTQHDEAEQLGERAALSVARYSFGRVVELETRAHELAMQRAGVNTNSTPGAVRWDADLLGADPQTAAAAWARSLHGYARRLPDRKRATFCAAVETPFYDVIDRAAIETAGGVHPKHHLMRYHDFFVERIQPGETVLDLGCGYGAVARTIVREAGAHVTGVDFSEENLALAKEMAAREGIDDRLRVIGGDITRDRVYGPAGEERFDVVVLSNVLEHLSDRAQLLSRYTDWYTPRAVLIRVPAFDRNWQTAWKQELGVDSRCDPTHETEYTEQSLRDELAEAGLSVIELIVRWGEYWVHAGAAGKASPSDRNITAGAAR